VESQVGNVTGAAQEVVPTYIYTALLADNTTTFQQTFAFHNQTSNTQFAGIGFNIGAGSLKWSVNLTSSASDTNSNLTLRYRLSSLGSTSVSASAVDNATITKIVHEPHPNMTTYYIPLRASSNSPSSRLAVKVVVFDVAIVDGQQLPLTSHRIVLINSSSIGLPEYVLELVFPAFNNSLYYDPSLSLGLLLGHSSREGSGSSSGSMIYAAGAAALPVAVVVALIVVLVVILRRKRRRRATTLQIRASSLQLNSTNNPVTSADGTEPAPEPSPDVVYHEPLAGPGRKVGGTCFSLFLGLWRYSWLN
jgi:hypothetical protein